MSDHQVSTETTGFVGSAPLTVIPFIATASLVSTTAGTPVTLVSDTVVPAGKKVYLTGYRANVSGATAWSGGTLTIVTIQDSNGTPVVFSTLAVAGLTANANLAPTSSNTTLGTAYSQNTGGTAAKGLVVVGDHNAGAGSTLIVTVHGFIQ